MKELTDKGINDKKQLKKLKLNFKDKLKKGIGGGSKSGYWTNQPKTSHKPYIIYDNM
jgi:hypothetical protein